MKNYIHRCKNGNKIPIEQLELGHLENIIAYIKRKSIEGVKIVYGGGYTQDDFHYDEEWLYGKEAKRKLHYKIYKEELKRRLKS
ncbi:MAG: hypothetical protein UR61_C0032G0004 [candidate division WS6 bacterium GW2011_GWE1_34_7]|uniref:Uncharacterized protein n=1 Tax=candidate division WS6 bacterium GW2011_GWE1_34_7 TaxID=1619093 RepID=A0A0G0DQ45_9BACT|nr:MAG: hypothetical protein UR61_C0032G0004 [candidate division WS6 bacterium GW2011_GWE1_34_7]